MGDYERYKAAVAAEYAIQTRLYRSICSLSPSRIDLNLAERLAVTKATMAKDEFDIVAKDRTLDEILAEARSQMRTAAFGLVELFLKIVGKHLAHNQNEYLKKLRKNRHLPIVTYDSKTKEDIESARTNSSRAAVELALRQPYTSLSFEAWEALIEDCCKDQAALKALAVKLSSERAAWQKYTDDSRRLQFASWSVMIAAISLIATNIPRFQEMYQNAFGPERPRYTCIRMDGARFICKAVR